MECRVAMLALLLVLSLASNCLSDTDRDDESVAVSAMTKLLSLQSGEKYLWYVPSGGFGNQMISFQNALRLAGILNRTLIVPPLLKHFELEVGDCGESKVFSPESNRKRLWRIIWRKLREKSYISMADLIDLSKIDSKTIRTIDHRLFVALHCGLNITNSLSLCRWCGPLIAELARRSEHVLDRQLSVKQNSHICGTILGALTYQRLTKGRTNLTQYLEPRDCTSMAGVHFREADGQLAGVYRYGRFKIGRCPAVDSGPLDYFVVRDGVEKRLANQLPPLEVVNVAKYWGTPGTAPEEAQMLSLGSTFHYFDLDMPSGDQRFDEIACQTVKLGFSPKIMIAAVEFVEKKLPEPFVCLHFRGGDGYFSRTRDDLLRKHQQSLERIRSSNSLKDESPVKLFIMTDMLSEKWKAKFQLSFPGFDVIFSSDFQSMEPQMRVDAISSGLGVVTNRVGRLELGAMMDAWEDRRVAARVVGVMGNNTLMMFMEQAVCSCAQLGFVGIQRSTFSRNILRLRQARVCEEYRDARR